MNIRLVATRLVVTDCDGVLTDNTFVYGPDGEKYRRWNMADGIAVQKLRAAGIQVVFLTQEESADIAQRAKALDVPVIVGGTDKLGALERQLELWAGISVNGRRKYPQSLSEVAYIGNEDNDVPVLLAVGRAFRPYDAWIPYGERLMSNGGEGCLREVAEEILRPVVYKTDHRLTDEELAGFTMDRTQAL